MKAVLLRRCGAIRIQTQALRCLGDRSDQKIQRFSATAGRGRGEHSNGA